MPAESEPPLWHGLVAGAAAGVSARLVTFPADTLKARLQIRGAIQADTGAFGSTLSAARHMLSTEGFTSFYRGFGAVMWGVVPANLAYFGGYELGKQVMPQQLGSVAADMATGAFAQLLAGVVYTPIDIVKERLQVAALMTGHYSYASPLDAFRRLLASGPAGVFKGYWATNAVWLPWNALYIAGYEQLKRQLAPALGCSEPTQLPAWAVAGCSASAAGAAALVTHPLDVVKTRLQVLSAAAASQQPQPLTALRVARQQLQREGLGSFWHGLTARLLNIAPGCALSWALYEHLKAYLDQQQSC